MKKKILLPGILAVIFSVSITAFAQDMKPLIASDSSILQTQAWLSNAIDKNSTYSQNRTVNSISRVKFDGCTLSYKIESATNYGRSSDQLPGAGNRSSSFWGTNTTLAFDLKEMNINGITLTPLTANSNMSLLTIPTLGGQKTVNYSFDTGNPKFNSSGFRSAATFAIKADIAEQIKTKLVQVAALCQK